jgi:phage gpG-like protein
MGAFVTVKILGGANLRAALAKMDPGQNYAIFKNAAGEIALEIAQTAKEKYLLKGRGPVDEFRLTNRSMRLYDSIGVDFSPLPAAVEVGSEVFYAAIHEIGGTFDVAAHSRRSKLGRVHNVRAHTRTVPKRPFLAPALADITRRIPEIVVKHWQAEVDRAVQG